MDNEHPRPDPLLFLKHLVRRHSRTDHPTVVRVQSSLLRIPVGASPFAACWRITSQLVQHPGPVLGLTSTLDNIHSHPPPAEASTTERCGHEGSVVGASEIPSRTDYSRLSCRSGGSPQHHITLVSPIVLSGSASPQRCSDSASRVRSGYGRRTLCDPSRPLGLT